MKNRALLAAGAIASVLLGTTLPSGAQSASTDPLRVHQWPLDVIGAEVAWAQTMGRGVTVAVIDTGVDLAHEDLAARLVPGNDFVDGDRTPQDVNGHGTHVAGVIAATRGNGLGLVGVAPEARIMPVRALDADGVGTPAAVIAAVQWAIDNGASVINLSVTEVMAQAGPFASSLASTIQSAWEKGVIVVLASGNDSEASTSGASYEKVPAIVVMATDRNDQAATYAKPVGNARWAIAAPGGAGKGVINDDVASTFWMSGQSNLYATMAGTSMAAPHVAGAAALLRSLGLSPAETVDRLLGTARDLGAPGRDPVFGAGRLDLSAAIQGVPQALQQTVVTEPPAVSTSEAAPELIPVTTMLNPVIEETQNVPPVSRPPKMMAPAPVVPPTSSISVLSGEPTAKDVASLPTKQVGQAQALSDSGPPGMPSRSIAISVATSCVLIAGFWCWKVRPRYSSFS